MKIAVLGTGMAGNAIATKLVQLGHQIMMGSRTPIVTRVRNGCVPSAAKRKSEPSQTRRPFGEIVFDCTNGANSIAALRQAGADKLRAKILIQVGNPLDTSKGMTPSLTVCNTDSWRTGATGVSRRTRRQSAQRRGTAT
jgi:8-hydroxy-5-deazaflavin:NADPH oxidoreductase